MRDSIKSYLYLTGLIVVFFYVSASYNACSEVNFEESVNPLSTLGNSVIINQGATFTKDQLVTLSLNGGLADEMQISNSKECDSGAWEPYVRTKSWSLPSTNQDTSVFVRYRTEGTETECFSDSIVHDNIAPSTLFENKQDIFTASRDAAIRFISADNLSGIKNVECALETTRSFSACSEQLSVQNLSDGHKVVWVKALDKAGNLSEPLAYRWAIDTKKPAVQINSAPPEVAGQSTADFAFIALDNFSGIEKVECRLDDGPYLICDSQTTHQVTGLSQGQHKLFIRAIDKAGNVSSDTIHTWTIDSNAPTVQIVDRPDPITQKPSAAFTFKGLDGNQLISSFLCELSNNTGTIQDESSCVSPKNISLLSDGLHHFSVSGIDSAGNKSAPAKYSWLIDSTPPSINFAQKPSDLTLSTKTDFVINATDGTSGVDKILCALNNISHFKDCSSIQSFKNLTEGRHEVWFKAIDKAGNQSALISHSWSIDLTAPIVEIDINNSVGDLVASSSAAVTFTATDRGSGVATTLCRMDSEVDFSPCTSPATVRGLVDGNHIFYVKAIDQVGNESSVKPHLWRVDTQGPSISMTAPEILFTGEDATLVFTLSDDLGGSGVNNSATICYYDALVTNVCAGNNQLVFPSQTLGSHSFRVVAQDNLGNSSSREVQWQVKIQTKEVSQELNIDENKDTDILFVVDNSGSMEDEHKNLAERVSGFLGVLSELNWQIAVTTTDVKNRKKTKIGTRGTLYPIKGLADQYILDQNINGTQAQQFLSNTIVDVGTSGSGHENGIEATYLSIERNFSGVDDDKTRQLNRFYRDNAHLAIVLISDENETSDELKNQPQKLVDLKNQYWPNKNFVWNSIIVKPGDTDCYAVQRSNSPNSPNPLYGYKYLDLSELTGGVVGSVCERDYASQVEDMAQKVLNLQKSVTLQCEPLDVDGDGNIELQVQYRQIGEADYGPVNEVYSVQGLQVAFDNFLPSGEYKFNYTCLDQ